jgi:PHD/YefM family antitoxin component YafN of YafNO toxin-antitoxin module
LIFYKTKLRLKSVSHSFWKFCNEAIHPNQAHQLPQEPHGADRKRSQPMVITQNGEATLVVIDVKSYEERENTLALLKLLALGNREIEQGQFRDAEDVFASLDAADPQ